MTTRTAGEIALRISDYVSEKGIKQRAIANSIGISPQAMSETLQGKRTLTADEYQDICIFLEVPYGKFLNPLPQKESVA